MSLHDRFRDAVIQPLKEDFARSANGQSRILVTIIRLRCFFHAPTRSRLLGLLPRILVDLAYLGYAKIIHNCDISAQVAIGEGLRLVHPYNIIIADNVRIGRHCKLLHEVTIGYSSRRGKTGVPIIGNDVEINAGAKVVGPITIGDHARIGANAVAYKDIPAHSIVMNSVEIRDINNRSSG